MRNNIITSLLLVLAVGFFVWCSWVYEPASKVQPVGQVDYQPKYPVQLEVFGHQVHSPWVGKVVRVLDGDTLDVELFTGSVVRVRLAGVDAPEKKQPFGKEAAEYTRQFTCTGQVGVYNVEQDRYGRLIAFVFVEDKCLNASLLQGGYAWHYRAYSKSSSLDQLQNFAADEKIGLWSEQNPIAPWDWRDGIR